MERSPRPGLRERRARQLRSALVESAQTLFAERGFAEVSVDDIADRAQASKRTFFRYFGVKEDVLFAEDDALLGVFLDGLRDALDSGAPAVEAAAAGVGRVAAQLQPRREELRVRRRVLAAVPALQDRAAGKYARWEREALEAAADQGEDVLGDLETAVPLALLTLRLGYDRWLAGTAGEDLQAHVDEARTAARGR